MGFKNNAFATLWNIDKQNKKLIIFSDKYADINISTSKKDTNNNYETDFSGKVRCLGKAFNVLKQNPNLEEKDRIKLLSVEVQAKYNKEKNTTYTNYLCWELEVPDKKDNTPKQPEVIDTDLPELTELDEDSSLDFLE